MRFQGRSASTSVLPKIENRSEVKLRYKGIEELGNDLRSMWLISRHETDRNGQNRPGEPAADSGRRAAARPSGLFDAGSSFLETSHHQVFEMILFMSPRHQ